MSDRTSPAQGWREHEEWIALQLRMYGWTVTDLGRAAPRKTAWSGLPDFHITRARRTQMLVDAKHGLTVSKAALSRYDDYSWSFLIPVVICWSNGRVNLIDELVDNDLLQSGTAYGTKYWRVPPAVTRPFEDVFGKNAHPLRRKPTWQELVGTDLDFIE